MVAIGILTILMAMIFTVYNQVSKAWTVNEARTETFQGSRFALDLFTHDLEGAIVVSNATERITFQGDEDSAILPGAVAGVVPTPPNDQLFFVSNASDSWGQDSMDLTEYGYMVVFATSDVTTMKKGHYYLLRHRVKSTDQSNWDFLTNPVTSWGNGWPSTPDVTTVAGVASVTPILDNVLCFEIRYQTRGYTNTVSATSPYGTEVLDTWRNSGSASNPTNYPSDYGIGTTGPLPEDYLPNGVHVYMSVLDRRYAERLRVLKSSTGGQLSTAELAAIPFAIETATAIKTNPPLQQTLREGLRTFYRTVNLRNAQ